MFTPLDFGGVGDGIADDTVAVQAAIDANWRLNPGVVTIGPGTYRVTSVLRLEPVTTLDADDPPEDVAPEEPATTEEPEE
jgi:polygalacturonase